MIFKISPPHLHVLLLQLGSGRKSGTGEPLSHPTLCSALLHPYTLPLLLHGPYTPLTLHQHCAMCIALSYKKLRIAVNCTSIWLNQEKIPTMLLKRVILIKTQRSMVLFRDQLCRKM